MEEINCKHRSIEFYRSIYREVFNIDEDTEFFPGTPEVGRRIGIDIAIEKMNLSGEEQRIVVLKHEKKASNKDIAASLLISESKVSNVLSSFRTQIKLSPYKMYIKCGDQAGERYSAYVKGLFGHKKNEEFESSYENYAEQIGWLDTTILGLFGVSTKLIKKLLEAGFFQIEAVIDAVKHDAGNWDFIKNGNKKDAEVLLNVLKEYRLLNS